MRYTYTCNRCRRQVVQTRKIDERDREEACPSSQIEALDWKGEKTPFCDGKLVRDGIELTARMSNAWKA